MDIVSFLSFTFPSLFSPLRNAKLISWLSTDVKILLNKHPLINSPQVTILFFPTSVVFYNFSFHLWNF